MLAALAVGVGAWLFAPAVLATDPDGGSTPSFSGAPTGTPYPWPGTTPKDGTDVHQTGALTTPRDVCSLHCRGSLRSEVKP